MRVDERGRWRMREVEKGRDEQNHPREQDELEESRHHLVVAAAPVQLARCGDEECWVCRGAIETLN